MKELYLKYENSNDEKERIFLIKEFEKQFDKFSIFLTLNYKTLRHRDISYALSVLSKKKSLNMLKILEHNKMEITKSLINSTDAKTRKNMYITLGNLQNTKFKNLLITALDKEQTFFAIPSLILALGNFSKTFSNLKSFKENLNLELCPPKIKAEIDSAFFKAFDKQSENNELNFKEFNKEHFFLLTTENNLKSPLISEINQKFKTTEIKEGVIVKTKDIKKLFEYRCFYKCLIFDKNLYKIDKNYEKLIKNLIKSIKNIDFLNIFENLSLLNYRTTTNIKNSKNLLFNLTTALSENFTYLKNSPSHYDFEIIIKEEKDTLSCYINPTFIKDERFNYRHEDLPASINPTTSAIINHISKKYIKNPINVLDPFCGTSTMLIEHSFLNKKANLYGVDISKTAIEKSKINSLKASVNINLTNSDILQFNTTVKFDLIISNLPFGSRVGNHKSNIELYNKFINKIPDFLNKNGYVLLYSTEVKLLTNLINENKNLTLINKVKMESGSMNPSLFVIKNK